VAQSLWGANVQTNAACEVRLLRDGSVQVLSSVQDLGTGIGTILAQVVAEELGLQPADITVLIGDTDFPAGPPSYGSRTTASVTPPARTAAWRVLQQLLTEAAPALNTAADNLVAREGRIFVRDDQSRSLSFVEAAARLRSDHISAVAARSDDYGGFRRRVGQDAALAQQDLGGVQFAQVSVDTETGTVRVERVVAVQDCGRPINPLQIESQVHGGVLMGLSFALFEDRLLDPQRPAVELERTVRALHPHVGARVALGDGTLLAVHSARVLAQGPPAGELAAQDGRLVYGTSDGGLQLLCVQPPGGRAMEAEAYLRGHAV